MQPAELASYHVTYMQLPHQSERKYIIDILPPINAEFTTHFPFASFVEDFYGPMISHAIAAA